MSDGKAMKTNPAMISVVIPAYNEALRLPRYLSSIIAYFELQGIDYEIIVVDDGSTDATTAVVERVMSENVRVRLIRLPRNHGKGHAVKTGMLQARGSLRLFADADGATPIAELERLRTAIKAGADIAIASRSLHDDSCHVAAKLHRKMIGSVFSMIVRLLSVKGISDTQCGFKLFTAEAAQAIFPLQRIDGFGFDVEILFIGKHKGYRIAEVPVNWTDVAGSKVKLVRDSCRMLLDVLTIGFTYARRYRSN